MKTIGKFFGIGVGPGDPELLTLKALRVLNSVPVLAVPRSSESGDGVSRSFTIVKEAVDLSGKEVLELPFPMTMDKDALKMSRNEAAARIVERLEKGTDVAFITLGDPMLYSTFSYLMPLVLEALPSLKIESVPGVTSFAAASCAALCPLAESNERVIIIPAVYDMESLREAILSSDTVVLMKVSRHFDKVLDLLESMGLKQRAFMASRVGWPEGTLTKDLEALRGRKLDYFSTLIIRKGAVAQGA